MGEIVYRADLSAPVNDFWQFMANKVYEFGETWALAIEKSTLAEGYGKSLRTVQRYIKELEDKQYIDTATKKGKGGGTVIVFNKDKLDFEPKVNPITDSTKSVDELLDKLYPTKPKKEPKTSYRSKAVIAEERLRNRLRRNNNDRLNDMMEETGYPTREFWLETPEPEKYYKAYLITRMYNFYAVYMPEKHKNIAEKSGNFFKYHGAELFQKRYENYDVLPKRFIGTSNFTVALKLVDVFQDDINPAAYLTVQFQYMNYLKSLGKNVGLPYFNSLISEKAATRWDDTYNYKRGFRKEHPYYALGEETVQIEAYSTPIMTMLISEYNTPFTESSYEEYLEVAIDPMVSTKRSRIIYGYYTTIKEEIKNDEGLSKDEQTELSQWVAQQTATHLKSQYPEHAYLVTNLDQIVRKITDFEGDNYRELFYELGSFTQDKAVDSIEIKSRIKRGYNLYFSVAGHSTFYDALRALRNSRGVEIDDKLIARAIEKFGERKIPITEYGNLDVHAIAKQYMTDEELETESKENALVIKGEGKKESFFDGLWYDIKEDYVGQSTRDGRMVL